MRQLCWIVLAAPALLGQISDYAINGNGDATYLVTNWRLRGQPDTGERRLFRIGEGAPQLVAAQPAAGFASVLVGDGEKVVLVVTTNGNRMAITGAALTAAQTQALSQLPSSSVGLSPNGRYLYRYAGCSDGAVIRYDLTKPPSDWSRRFAYPDVRPGSCPNWVASFRPDNQGREVMYLPSRGAIQVQDDSGARDLSFPLGQGLGSVQLVPGRNELLVTTDTADSAERRFLRVNLTTGQEQEVTG